MAEFALVLLVKRNLEKGNANKIESYDGLYSKLDILSKKIEIGAKDGQITLVRTQEDGDNETKQGEIPPTLFWKWRIRQLHLLSLTTKIDVLAFVVFCCSYAIFNVIYYIYVV